MGVKAGLDPAVMIDVINAGSGPDHGFGRKISAGDSAAHVQLRFRDRADAQRRPTLRPEKREA